MTQTNCKLIKCLTCNKDGHTGIRYVEVHVFNLWKFMMEQRHQTRVSDPMLCLWVPEDEFEQHRNLYEHSGETEEVSRILVTVYDDQRRFTSEVVRFSPTDDCDRLVEILRSHVDQRLLDTDAVQIDIEAGWAVSRYAHLDAAPLELDLHASSVK